MSAVENREKMSYGSFVAIRFRMAELDGRINLNLVPRTGLEPATSALKGRHPNH